MVRAAARKIGSFQKALIRSRLAVRGVTCNVAPLRRRALAVAEVSDPVVNARGYRLEIGSLSSATDDLLRKLQNER